jgi:hypothetical protein
MSQVNCPFNKLAATSAAAAAGLIASFLDEGAIDEFIISVIPTFIGEGTPLIAPRHREVPLRLLCNGSQTAWSNFTVTCGKRLDDTAQTV